MDPLDFIDGIAALAHPDEEMIYSFVQGQLPCDREKAVSDHLTSCPHCCELAEMFGWSPVAQTSTEVARIQIASRSAAPRRRSVGQARLKSAASHDRSRPAWRLVQADRLAASEAETSGGGPEASGTDAVLVQLVPDATDGDAALGYLCAGGADVIVTGAGDGPAMVQFGGIEYELRSGAADEPRVVEGLTRQHVAIWLAGGRHGRFGVVHK